MNLISRKYAGPDIGVAIIGMAGRFPGAATIGEFWANLCAGKESITRFTDDELEDWFDEETRRATNFVKARPILEGVDLFDANFFSMHAREAELTDPQHRLFLECAWEALENAGYDPAAFTGAIGVFAGCSLNTYFLNNICRDRRAIELFTSSYQVGCYPELLGASQDFLATRVSYKLDLRGPSVTLQTACSTSLLAVAEACQSLQLHQSDMALAGGVSITFPQRRGYLHQEGGMVSADGSCRPFDARATGTVFGSGTGIVLLKRLADAVEDGDQIYAVIRGCGVTNDGSSKVGFTAPSVDGQAAAIEMALASAGIDARTVSYVECHGTATPLGDPIEITGLTEAYRGSTQDCQFCAVGSVKSNIGHLDAAAGVVGLIKTALALSHRQLPPSLHFKHANPHIQFPATPFFVQSELTDWQAAEGWPRRAGVSSFGVGGTNVHVVLEEQVTPERPADEVREQEAHLIVVSARTQSALEVSCDNLAAHLQSSVNQQLGDISYTLQMGRRAFEHRAAFHCRSIEEAASKLTDRVARKRCIASAGASSPPIVFMFPGQGAQYPDMARGLYEREAVFRRCVDDCAEILMAHGSEDLRNVLYPMHKSEQTEQQLLATLMAQPAMFTVEYALAQLWMSWGIAPSALIGHSIGEFVAACLAGVMSLEDALTVVAERGRLIQALPGGSMLAVRRSAEEIEALLPPSLALAAVNAPSLCVVAGADHEIAAFASELEAKGAVTRRLHTSHAFHSPMMDAIIEPLRRCVERVALAEPAIPLISGVTGRWLSAEEAMRPGYWALHARAPVQFAAGIGQLDVESWPVLLEVGPGNTLASLAFQAPHAPKRLILVSLPDSSRNKPDRDFMLESLGRLWTAGAKPDWAAIQGRRRFRVPLPTYPFQRSRYWIDPPRPPTVAVDARPEEPMSQPAPSSTLAAPPVSATVSADEQADGLLESVRAKIAGVIEELSGQPPEAATFDTPFLELGFDSLFLSQVTQRIQSQLKIKIAFRQLLSDYSTIEKLASFAERELRASTSLPAKLAAITSERAPAESQVAEASAAEEATRSSRFDVNRRQGFSTEFTPAQRQHIADLASRYATKTAGSKERTQRWRPVLADPRAVAGFRLDWKEMVYPIVCARSQGSRLWDVDGNEYIDLVNGYGQTAFGHSPQFVIEAVREQLAKGFAIGPQAELAGEVAALISEMTGNERLTFCNTGSEAVMAAMRVARAVTGRDKIVLFSGAYHGQFDEVLVKGVKRPDGLPRTVPAAVGIPASTGTNIVVLDYASKHALEWLVQNASDLAAVIVEPVQSRHPDLRPVEFLKKVREITAAADTAFVMDEIVTGFRVHPGGMQALTGIRADMATYGKVVGGGLPIGILAGKSKYMDALDGGLWSYGDDSYPEVGVTFFAGTFVRHPLALAATRAVLTHLKNDPGSLHREVVARTTALVANLSQMFREHGLATAVENYSSFFYFDLFNEHPLARLLYYHLRLRGVHIQDGFPCFLTTAHSQADVEHIAHAFRESLAELRHLGIFGAPQSEKQGSLPTASAGETRAEPCGSTPLTESQIEIWLAAQLGDAASCAFNESITLRLSGRLDESILRRALDQIVGRHESLRACFGATGEMMRVLERVSLDGPTLDLSGEPDPEASFGAVVDEDARKPFDLVNGPLIRVQLARLGAESHALLLTAHHIICDGWSVNVILRELATIYDALCRGEAPTLPAPLAFSQYARGQRDLPPDEMARLDGFWLAKFERPVAPLELPADRPRPALKSFRGGSRCLVIDAELCQAVREAGSRYGATLFVTLLAAYQVLLGRLAEQDEVIVGIPTAGQALLGNEILVGQCVNFLPLRGQWMATTPFAEFMTTVRERVLDAYEHQTYTLGTLVRKLGLARETNRLPLVEAQFNLERLADKLHLIGLKVEVEPNPKAFVNFDLFLNAIESDDGLRLDCDYNADLWNAATVDRWLEHYRRLLQSIAGNPETPIGRLSYLAGAEIDRILKEPNRTARDFPRERCIHDLFRTQALARPQSIAAVCDDQAMTYEDLDRASNRFANYLRVAMGDRRGPIGVSVGRSIDLLVALLGILKAGHAYLPLDPAHPANRRRLILDKASAAALVTDSADDALIAPAGTLVIELPPDRSNIAASSEQESATSTSAEDLAYVIFTSGSTGEPKGVEITHRSVVNLLTSMAQEPGLAASDVLMAITTVAFDIAALELFLPLTVGARVVIAPTEITSDGYQLRDAIHSCGATVMQATPSSWRMLLEAGFRAPAGFKMLCGGEPLPRDLAEELLKGSGELWNMYGPTETTIWSSCARIWAGAEVVTVGRPIANTQLYILDRNDQPVPAGRPGELLIGGEGLARGYLHRPELTADKFIANPFGAGHLYRTGDLARWMTDGNVQILGRIDDQVKLRGFRIELGEIEAVLRRKANLPDVAVKLHEDKILGPRLAAYFVEGPGKPQNIAELQALLSEELPAYMVPSLWMRVEKLPLSPNGKLDRKALPTPDRQPTKRTDRVAPRTDHEIALARIWAAVLGRDDIGVGDDLLSLGADSIHFFQITARANREGLHVTAKQLIQHRTIEALGLYLDRVGNSKADPASDRMSSLRRFRRQKGLSTEMASSESRSGS